MAKFKERDLFDVFEEWGYEVCAVDPEDLPPPEREEILVLQEAAAELQEEDDADSSLRSSTGGE